MEKIMSTKAFIRHLNKIKNDLSKVETQSELETFVQELTLKANTTRSVAFKFAIAQVNNSDAFAKRRVYVERQERALDLLSKFFD